VVDGGGPAVLPPVLLVDLVVQAVVGIPERSRNRAPRDGQVLAALLSVNDRVTF
jgi:hypothetical protein